ncbi:SAM-dependent methyltransferase [Kutzneria viridogrisea]|uniref:S-adenosyl methyltransferase n=2 Tax=Kutzneria TaxID=43356 RepID=W5W1T8_9PSEU|nr:SAM-dependent methyltransferase [Kutzneria albida]AHH94822.1 hypothetical protein KALB_1449 [Kutzneria albida DSM 43870]MBA8927834.1 SAM-dependent methyltransferase [Kutzneria viridogrisea]
MLDHHSWAPHHVDQERPNAARIYDYLLGGACHSAVDRVLAQQLLDAMPQARHVARANRAFLRRSVRYMAERGVRQFIDIGAGAPTAGSVHETARRFGPGSRVVYVDQEPIVVASTRLVVDGQVGAEVVHADFRQPYTVLTAPAVRELDFSRPIGLLLCAVLHYVPDSAGPAALLARYRDALPPGSQLALSHATAEGVSGGIHEVARIYAANAVPLTLRTKSEIGQIIAGFEPVEPGVVYVPHWRPESPEDLVDSPEVAVYGLVADLG